MTEEQNIPTLTEPENPSESSLPSAPPPLPAESLANPAPAATADPVATPPARTWPGMSEAHPNDIVQAQGGEYAGQAGRVLSVDGDQAVVLLDDDGTGREAGDREVTIALADLKRLGGI